MDSWNDERLGELSRRMDAGFKETKEGFAKVDREMKEGFARVDQKMEEGFARIDGRLAGLATREEVQVVSDRLFTLFCAVIVVMGGIISTLIAIHG